MIPSTSFAPVAAAVISRKRKKMIKVFRSVGALSPESARTLAEIGVTKSPLFEMLRHRGVFVELQEGRFYLDEARELETRQFRMYLVTGIALLCVILVFIGWWLGHS
ncbi:MAG TPA: hypothetical protein PK014_03955 [Thermoanaerobaculia bacterium]|nr:hypothetical protein [Thermoanaerobaculia bacterium]HUM29210.1 hypothetical protein [Thermoanaerobaculia bacterium]HXK67831.1 hypothetical protein [Thermoanaerobaculia bacterium]